MSASEGGVFHGPPAVQEKYVSQNVQRISWGKRKHWTYAEYVQITPEIAKVLLSNCDGRIREKKVRCIAKALIERKGSHSCTPVVVSFDGRLINGQHRLKAVVESGVTLTTWVFWNAFAPKRENVEAIESES